MRIRRVRPTVILRVLAAAVLAGFATILVERAGPTATTVCLFALLTVALWLALSLALAVPVSRRISGRFPGGWRGPRRWWPFGGNGRNGRGPGGVREPRRPRPPLFPPRTAAAEPDAVSDAVSPER